MAIEINPSTPSNPIPSVNGISVIWLGNWDNSKIYRRNEGIFYDGSSYRANKTTSQTPSLTATDWDLIAQGAVGNGSSTSTNLDGLTDVVISSASLGDILTYDSNTWRNQTASSLGLATTTNLNNHVNQYANPHNVTAAQVGKDTAQWNSDRIKGVTVEDSAKANGKVLKYNSTTNTIQYADDLTGSGVANLSQLGDVTITSPINNQALIYSTTSNKWVNQTIASGGSGESNTASNVGTAGVGVFKQKTGVNLEFRNINAGSSKVTITSDTANNEIDIDVNEANLSLSNIGGTLPVASGGTGSSTASAALTSLGAASSTALTSHIGNTSNPHSVTAAQVGAISSTSRGAANGVASLDASTLIPVAQIPSTIARLTDITATQAGAIATSARGTANGVASLDASTLIPVAQIPTTIARVIDITATQVGNTTAQWNASQIIGVNVATTTPTNGQVLAYSTANTRWEPTTPSGSSSSPILKVFSSGTGNQLSITTSALSTSYVSIPLSPQIIFTPASTNSKVLIRVSLNGLDASSSAARIFVALVRQNTAGTVIIQQQAIESISTTNRLTRNINYDFLDSPSTTLSTEYFLQVSSNVAINFFINTTVNSFNQGYSSLTVMEIA